MIIIVLITLALTGAMIFILLSPFNDQLQGSQGQSQTEALKILTKREGLYRVTLESIRAAGIAIDDINPSSLRLSLNGQTVLYYIDGDDLVFFGLGLAKR